MCRCAELTAIEGPRDTVSSAAMSKPTPRRAGGGRAASKSAFAAPPLAVSGAFLLGLAVYLRSVTLGFVWDDVNFIVENPLAHSLAGLGTALGKGYGYVPGSATGGDAAMYFRPVVVVANTIQYLLAQGAPWLFHLMNALTHAAAAACLAWLALGLGLGEGAALLAGGLFAAHPAYSEAVLWISGRTDLLAAAFGLAGLALWAQIRARASRGISPSRGLLALAPVTLLLGLLSKESAIATVVAAAVLVALPRVRSEGSVGSAASAGAVNREGNERHVRRPLLLGLASATGIYLVLRLAVMAGTDHSPLPDRGDFAQRFLQGGVLFLLYLKRMVLPWPSTTEAPQVARLDSLSMPLAVIGLALLAAAILLWVRALLANLRGSARGGLQSPGATIGLSLFLAGIAPVLQWIPTGEVYGERFLYLPAAGLLLFLLSLVSEALVLPRAYMLLLALGLPFAGLVQMRIPDWKDDVSLFASSVNVAPESARANANYGSALMKLGKNAEAEPYLKRAVELDDKDPQKRAQYGSLLVNTGRVDEGARDLESAYNEGLRSTTLLKNLGIAWTRQGRGNEASTVLGEALARSPNDPGLLEALAMARKKAGAFTEAANYFEQAIARDPSRRSAYLNLISVLGNELADGARAKQWCERFLSRFPAAAEAAQVRGILERLNQAR